MKKDYSNVIDLANNLFDEARDNGGIEYIYTLVRVSGIGMGSDKLIMLRNSMDATNMKTKQNVTKFCRDAIDNNDIYLLFINLLRCTAKETYSGHPFNHLFGGTMTDRIVPTKMQLASEIVEYATKKGKSKFSRSFKQIYTNEIMNYLLSSSDKISKNIEEQERSLYYFIKTFLKKYFDERLKYKDYSKLYKLPRFQVLELLTNDKYGLYGFKMYFSNGSCAYFERTIENTDCCNLYGTDPVNYMCGSLDDLKNEWMIADKKLFEIGLPGRYNELGEWKPIVFPADTNELIREVKTVTDDLDCQGAYFYILCTGHRVIEFVVRTSLELPVDHISFGNILHLYKCDSKEIRKANNCLNIYDGWVELEDCSIENIGATIRGIGLVLNVIGLTYGVPIEWRIKYKMGEDFESNPIPTSDDLSILDEILKKFPYKNNDARVLSYALDWYVRGRTSKNIFVRFLSYYIALESVSSAITEGDTDTDFGLGYRKGTRAEIKEKMIEDIYKLHNEFFETDPKKFVEAAYFDCVKGLKKRTQCIAELVFGPENQYIELLFKKSSPDNISLSEIRSKLAHGSIALFSSEEEQLVKNHLLQIEEISKEFLIRLILQIKPTEKLPSWSKTYKVEFTTIDPRSTLYCTTLDIFPKSKWGIRSEWVDSTY